MLKKADKIMPNLENESLGLTENSALLVVDMINGFTDSVCPLGTARTGCLYFLLL
jgi:hypothetical protein